ncbi:MAG: MBL fold metallo-hydrolase [Schwartzia sp.]|nr:MBL fold metallo-hydrolase [Schwartzia sp. (in: firmicutes)]
MRELIFLGTGSAMVTECYNTCFLLRQPDGEYFLTDAGGGNGILRQMKRVEADFEHLHYMFVTHGHTDHIIGVIWVLRKIATLMNEDIYDGEFHVYGHNVACQIIEMMAELMLKKKDLAHLGKRIQLHEIRDGETVNFLGMKLTAFDIASTKAKQFGYRLRFANRHTLTCLGDEPFNDRCKSYVEKTDWLLSEAFCRYEDREIFKPYEKNHSTVREASELAQTLQAKHLVLYHTEDKNLAQRKALYTAEARTYYNGEVFVPDDLDRIEID